MNDYAIEYETTFAITSECLKSTHTSLTYSGKANGIYSYSYDVRGNITSRKTYAYTTGTLGTVQKTDSYGYYEQWVDEVWNDGLKSYNGSAAFTYDAIGNPLTYNNGSSYTFTWRNGRQLASGTNGTKSFTYTYNSDGLRTSKTVGDFKYSYYWYGSQLAMMTVTDLTSGSVTSTCRFYYDANGTPIVFNYNGTEYYYITNLQGDVIGLADSSGVVVAYYTYDAWGKIISFNYASEQYYSALLSNPLRYRGYICDDETEFYYLQSRYYDPNTGRFINADSQLNTNSLLGCNLFAYCENNPVNRTDPTGQFWGEILEFFQVLFTETGKTMVTLGPGYAAGSGAALVDGPLPIGDVVAGVIVLGLTIYSVGCGISIATQALSTTSSKVVENEESVPETQDNVVYIYRRGGTNPGNLTPREKDLIDGRGLSFSTKPEFPCAMTTIEAINATGLLYAVKDGPTHVSVYPVGGTMEDWVNAGNGSIWTQAVKSVVIKWDGVS